MLLPHGYEGQGPEHSSARLERYLQLAAEENIQACQPSTAAQYFHMLRRQARRPWRKPLVVFTPKSMLRHPDASSPIEEFTRARFLQVVPDREVTDAKRVLIASGKVGHELKAERRRRKDTSTAILFLDQLYPLPRPELMRRWMRIRTRARSSGYRKSRATWGAFTYVMPRLSQIAHARGLSVRSVKRSASASPATGSGQSTRDGAENPAFTGITTTAAQ